MMLPLPVRLKPGRVRICPVGDMESVQWTVLQRVVRRPELVVDAVIRALVCGECSERLRLRKGYEHGGGGNSGGLVPTCAGHFRVSTVDSFDIRLRAEPCLTPGAGKA